MTTPTDWTLPAAVLVAGLIIGAALVYYFTRRRTPVAGAATLHDVELRDLEARRDLLVQQLRDLDPAADVEERGRLERETADVLRKIDAHRARAPRVDVPPPAPAVVNQGSTVRGFIWGASSMAALVLLAYFVNQSMTPRPPDATATGSQPQPPMAQGQQPSTDPAVLQLEARVKQTPDDLALRNDLAKAYLERDNMMGVFEQTQFVLGKRPDDAHALTYQAIVRTAMGQIDPALQMLDRATKKDPTLLDAWVALAWVNFQTGKAAAADAAIAEAKKQHPEESARLDQLLAQMKSAAQQAASQSQQAMPPNHPPTDGAPVAAGPLPGAAPRPTANDGKAIEVRLTIDPAARARLASGVIFVVARPAGVAAGPPAAATRVNLSEFTGSIALTSADSMLGQPIPDKVRIDVRLDSDGDATTKPPTDPSAFQDNVAAGTAISLTLK